jgi:histidine triad (HIT) family protein
MVPASLRWRTVSDFCIFCAIAAGDAPASIVYADDLAVAFLDLNPVTTGHTLVIPRRHVRDLLDASGAVAEIGPAVEATAALLVDRLGADGVNAFQATGAAAGQTVFHLHVHLLPRSHGDGLLNMHAIRAEVTDDLATTHARLTA